MSRNITFDMRGLEELNSELFIYENYEPDWWTALDLSFCDAVDVSNVLRKVNEYAIGYCDSSRVRLRPKDDCFAVMFEKNGRKFWFHIQKWEFEKDLPMF